MLQKDIRAKNNEVVNLTATLQKLTKESAELKAKLDGTLKESTLMAKEINQLQEWRRKAEVSSYVYLLV
jgi:regulator of replication initiation timing